MGCRVKESFIPLYLLSSLLNEIREIFRFGSVEDMVEMRNSVFYVMGVNNSEQLNVYKKNSSEGISKILEDIFTEHIKAERCWRQTLKNLRTYAVRHRT